MNATKTPEHTPDPSSRSTIAVIADWVVGFHATKPAPSVVNQAALLLLDTLGCGFAALEDEVALGVLGTVEVLGGAASCSLIGQGYRTSITNAVLANGALVRVLDLNDYQISNRLNDGHIVGHASDNIPVALAVAEARGASGRDALQAIILAYQLYTALRDMMPRQSVWDGVTVSAMVAAAVTAFLSGFDREKTASALALAAARGSTSAAVRAGHVSAAKSIANAMTATTGVLAALLAGQPGLTGPVDIMEQKDGLHDVFPNRDVLGEFIGTNAGTPEIMKTSLKRYPCLATGQSTVAAGLEMHRKLGGTIGTIERIDVVMADYPIVRHQQADPARRRPNSREAADHSFGFLAAVSLIDGHFGTAQYGGTRWEDPAVCALMERIRYDTDPKWAERAPLSYPCSLRVHLVGGETQVADIAYPPGCSPDGLERGAVIEKFDAFATPVIGTTARNDVIAAIDGLESAPDTSALTAVLVPRSETGALNRG